MSLKPCPIQPVPEETARVARAAFPKGNPYLTLRDELGTIYHDEVSSIHPFVDTLRFIRLVLRSQRWRRKPGRRT